MVKVDFKASVTIVANMNIRSSAGQSIKWNRRVEQQSYRRGKPPRQELALARWCIGEELEWDWNEDPQVNEDEVNDGFEVDGFAGRNNDNTMVETSEGAGVLRMNQEHPNPQLNQKVVSISPRQQPNMWRRGGPDE